MKSTDLSYADMRHSLLEGVDLSYSNLSHTDLRDAKHLRPEQVKVAKNFQQAIYDSDFSKQLGLHLETTSVLLHSPKVTKAG
ncbi:MAG: pentapeptide repeat-containing protein [Scytonema sp. PMC 1069.18]|nr:pentapeptide repeat-containing protein [Scytonema sp. PMC 1069.18]MEC4881560.1 pentapeptide repeat-containing protein [Scytonema sp. PMC 1070.18]